MKKIQHHAEYQCPQPWPRPWRIVVKTRHYVIGPYRRPIFPKENRSYSRSICSTGLLPATLRPKQAQALQPFLSGKGVSFVYKMIDNPLASPARLAFSSFLHERMSGRDRSHGEKVPCVHSRRMLKTQKRCLHYGALANEIYNNIQGVVTPMLAVGPFTTAVKILDRRK